jgi:dCMP deaminase
MSRISKNRYYLEIALSVAKRSTCLRRRYGVVIVNNDQIISTGYNGSPRNVFNCDENNFCLRDSMKVPPGERYELCTSVHAEMNAIISASRKDLIGAHLYLIGVESNTGEFTKYNEPCLICKRLIINAGIKRIITFKKEDSSIIETPIENYIVESNSTIRERMNYEKKTKGVE